MHHVSSEQRTFIRFTIGLAILTLLIAVPLVASEGLRLRLAHALELVPGGDAERLYDGDAAVRLVSLVEEVPQSGTSPSRRFTAVYIVERADDQLLLHDLNQPRILEVPLTDYDRIAAAADGSAILVVDQTDGLDDKAAFVTIDSGEVELLPDGVTEPDIPGDWDTDISVAGGIECAGTSPQGNLIACIRGTQTGSFLVGDWELQVYPAGNIRAARTLYRGRGFAPIVGWTADESTIYFHNEHGLWRIGV